MNHWYYILAVAVVACLYGCSGPAAVTGPPAVTPAETLYTYIWYGTAWPEPALQGVQVYTGMDVLIKGTRYIYNAKGLLTCSTQVQIERVTGVTSVCYNHDGDTLYSVYKTVTK